MFRTVNALTVVLFLITFIFTQFSSCYVISRSTRELGGDSDDSDDSGLYYGFRKATILNSTNFNKELFTEQKDKLWLVEFYNHWCGYCIRFVAVMKAFASEVYDWRDVVKIGTIDCANSKNNEICRNHEIKKVPSIKIFPPNSEENFVGLEFGKGSETTIPEMRENLAQILKSYHNSQEQISGPVNLKLLRHDVLDRLWNKISPSAIYIMLVFEPKDSLVGSQVALDISRTAEVRVRLVDPKNKNLTQLVGMKEGESGAVVVERNPHPSVDPQLSSSYNLIEINDLTKVDLNEAIATEGELKLSLSAPPNDINGAYVMPPGIIPLAVENFTREGLNKAVRKFLIERGVDIAPDLPDIPIIHTNVSVDEIKEAIRREGELKKALNVAHLSTVVFQMDLEAAIVYAMAREVTLKRNITAEQLDVLRNFMTVIIKYFPTGEQGRTFFTELKEKELDKKDSLCGEDFSKTFKELEEKYNPFMPNLEWVGCRGTIPMFRGYPCSLWTLFHTLVASEELHDRNIPDEEPEALNAIAGYIRYFFSCSQCAEHFNQMAKTIAGNVTSNRDAVMWLWKAHNNVNRRLAGDETEDPRHHKVQFPTRAACPSCYAAGGSWDESRVFAFLSKKYTDIVHLDPDDLPGYPTTTTAPPPEQTVF